MTHLKTPKFWLLTTAALMCGPQMSAQAQLSDSYGSNYEYGTPTMVAAAPSLPTIRAEQIAQDVTTEYNPRTGRTEFIAAPFDPFEQDPNLAGAAKLRSADGGVAIDGQALQGGAILDVDFYYNSPSDDPHRGRNYSDASFINGQLAPVVMRDSRILECSTRVENVVYDHSTYYSPSRPVGIYQPYRHYTGHSGFGFGFGSAYLGPGYNYYDRNRSGYSRIRGQLRTPRRIRGVRSGYRDDRRDRDRDRDGDRNRDSDRDRDRDRNGDRNGDRRDDRAETGRRQGRGLTAQQRENRLRAIQLHGSALPMSGAARRNGRSTLSSANPRDRIAIGTVPSQSQSTTPKVAPQVSRSDLKNPERRTRSRRTTTPEAPASRGDASRAAAGRAVTAAREAQSSTLGRRTNQSRTSQPRTSQSRSSAPASRTAPPPASRPSSSRSSSSRTSKSRSSSSRSAPSRSSSSRSSRGRQMDFFPASVNGGRQVMTSSAIECAREDKLRVFVSNERLDAARFDGLTLIALDAQGHETPIYIPPNYIEGFRLAASGRIRPQGYQPQDYQSQGSYSGVAVQRLTQTRQIEAAPCPTGTSKQPDGTCLQNSVSGYPYR